MYTLAKFVNDITAIYNDVISFHNKNTTEDIPYDDKLQIKSYYEKVVNLLDSFISKLAMRMASNNDSNYSIYILWAHGKREYFSNLINSL